MLKINEHVMGVAYERTPAPGSAFGKYLFNFIYSTKLKFERTAEVHIEYISCAFSHSHRCAFRCGRSSNFPDLFVLHLKVNWSLLVWIAPHCWLGWQGARERERELKCTLRSISIWPTSGRVIVSVDATECDRMRLTRWQAGKVYGRCPCLVARATSMRGLPFIGRMVVFKYGSVNMSQMMTRALDVGKWVWWRECEWVDKSIFNGNNRVDRQTNITFDMFVDWIQILCSLFFFFATFPCIRRSTFRTLRRWHSAYVYDALWRPLIGIILVLVRNAHVFW